MAKKKSFWKALFGMDDHEKGSANTATERLKVIVASENRLNSRLTNERIERMKREILEVVNKYVNGVQIDDVNLNHRHEDDLDVLEMNINLPDKGVKKAINTVTTQPKIDATPKPVNTAQSVEVKKVELEAAVKPQTTTLEKKQPTDSTVTSNNSQPTTNAQNGTSQTVVDSNALNKVLGEKNNTQ